MRLSTTAPASCGIEAGIGTSWPGALTIRVSGGGALGGARLTGAAAALARPRQSSSGASEANASAATEIRLPISLPSDRTALALERCRCPAKRRPFRPRHPLRRFPGCADRVRRMPTVREATFELFRKRGMTTVFGNPGSTELPMLRDFPSDFRYVLGLQEAVVVGMADGFAQASDRTTVVNLHTAPGVGNAMGAIFNAQANHSPLLITAGQQVRAHITMQANLTNRDATRMPHPLVKWSYEPPRAEDVPLALAHGAHLAGLAPRGPVFVSLPMDDWEVEVDAADARHATTRKVTGRAVADPTAIAALAAELDAAKNPVLVAGPDIDTEGGWGSAA